MNRWTQLFVRLEDGEMKRIGNVNPASGAISMYPEGMIYYDSPNLYYLDNHGLYQQYSK